MCAKGDRCAFSHGPQPAGTPQPPPAAKIFTPALQPNSQLKNSWTKPNSSGQQNTPAGIQDKSKFSTHDTKPVQKQHVTSRVDHSSRTYQNHSNSYAQSGTTKHYQPQPSVQDGLTENGMEAGEFVREPSAGSGVLVAGVNDDSEQSFKGNRSSYHHHTERSYRSSAERLSSDKRILEREPMPAVISGSSDLRHRLLKQRRLNNNLRSIEAPDMNDACVEGERNDQHRWRGEEHDDPLPRSRLRDRIRLPDATSFDRHGSRSEKELDRGPRGRLSPPKHLDLRGKLLERLKVRSAEEIPVNSVKSSVVKASSGEDAESLNFAGPKSLAELKARKGGGSSSREEAIIKGLGLSRVPSGTISSRETAPFEGPKPLSAILKRKREVASEDAAAHFGSIQEEDNAAGVDEESQILADDTVEEENMEGNTAADEEGEEEAFHPEDDVAYDDNTDEATGQDLEEHQDVETAGEDYDYEAPDTNTAAGQELEEHQDVEAAAEDYDYEAADVNAEEDNEYQEYQDDDDLEDNDDDDDDDFARKVGVMIS